MDLNLPGHERLRGAGHAARRSADPAHIPVIALTANAMPRDIEARPGAGFFRYLTKPIDIAEFNEAIDSALASSAGPG